MVAADPLFAAQHSLHTNFVSLIKQIPPPATSITGALSREKDLRITARFKKIETELESVNSHLQRLATEDTPSARALSTTTKETASLPRNPQEAAALHKKLAGMTRQQKLAFVMRLQHQQVQAALHSGSAHAVKPLPADVKTAYAKLSDISQRFNPTQASAADSFFAKPFASAEAQLDTQLQALTQKYPFTEIKGFHGSDELGYEHDEHLCHTDYDNRIMRSHASEAIYDAWMKARHDAWADKAKSLATTVAREEHSLKTIQYGDALRQNGHSIAYRKVIHLEVNTLAAIRQLANEAKARPDRFPVNIDGQTAALKQRLASCLADD